MEEMSEKRSVESNEQFKGFLIHDCGYSMPLYSSETGVWAALHPLITTLAIVFDCDRTGFKERYCFRDQSRAIKELIEWHKRGFGVERPTGWVACRNVEAETLKESMDRYQSYTGDFYGQNIIEYMNENEVLFFRGAEDYLRAAISLGIPPQQVEHEVAYLRAVGLIEC